MKFIVALLFLCTNIIVGQNKPQDIWYAKTFASKSKTYPKAINFNKAQRFFNKKYRFAFFQNKPVKRILKAS